MVDGTDQLEEGNWIFTRQDDRPYLPRRPGDDDRRNCLNIANANTISHTSCPWRTHRAMVCESEGSYRQLITL